MNLIVVFPFGPYARGQRIDDATEVEIILLGENASRVRKVPLHPASSTVTPPEEAAPPQAPSEPV